MMRLNEEKKKKKKMQHQARLMSESRELMLVQLWKDVCGDYAASFVLQKKS